MRRLEAEAGGEFNIGTAQQMGSAELNNADFSNQVNLIRRSWSGSPLAPNTRSPSGMPAEVDYLLQDLRRSNFTSAECRSCNFKNANLAGTYFIKAVLPKANFEVSRFHRPTEPNTFAIS